MSIIKTEINAKIYLELTEGEALALKKITEYGPRIFIEWFSKTHSSYAFRTNQEIKDMTSMFQKARCLGYALHDLKNAKEQLKNIKTD